MRVLPLLFCGHVHSSALTVSNNGLNEGPFWIVPLVLCGDDNQMQITTKCSAS